MRKRIIPTRGQVPLVDRTHPSALEAGLHSRGARMHKGPCRCQPGSPRAKWGDGRAGVCYRKALRGGAAGSRNRRRCSSRVLAQMIDRVSRPVRRRVQQRPMRMLAGRARLATGPVQLFHDQHELKGGRPVGHAQNAEQHDAAPGHSPSNRSRTEERWLANMSVRRAARKSRDPALSHGQGQTWSISRQRNRRYPTPHDACRPMACGGYGWRLEVPFDALRRRGGDPASTSTAQWTDCRADGGRHETLAASRPTRAGSVRIVATEQRRASVAPPARLGDTTPQSMGSL